MVNFILVSRKHGPIVSFSSIFLFLVLYFNRVEFAKWRVLLVKIILVKIYACSEEKELIEVKKKVCGVYLKTNISRANLWEYFCASTTSSVCKFPALVSEIPYIYMH